MSNKVNDELLEMYAQRWEEANVDGNIIEMVGIEQALRDAGYVKEARMFEIHRLYHEQ